MPDNLTVTIGADTAPIRAQFTLLTKDLQDLGKQLRDAAKAGDTAQVNQLSAAYEKLRGQVRGLNTELKSAGTSVAASGGLKSVIGNVEALATSFGGLAGLFKGGLIGLGVKEVFDLINGSLNETSQRLTDIKKASDATGLRPLAVQAFTELAKESRSAVDPLMILTRTMSEFGKAAIAAGDTQTMDKGVRTMRGMGDVAKDLNGELVRMKGSFAGGAQTVEVFRGGIKNVIDLAQPLKTLKIQENLFPKTPEGEVEKLKAVATALIEMHKNRPDLADAVGVALYGKRFAELESVLKAIAEGKLDEKVKDIAASARGTTPELQALNEKLKQSYDELAKAQEDAAANSLRTWAPVKIFFTDLFTQILKGSNEGPKQWADSLQTISDNFAAHPPAFMTMAFWDELWAGIKTGATDAANWIANAFNAASAAVSSALSQTPGGGLPALPFAGGGFVQGPGTGTSDSIMARLSNGEFVMRAAAVDRWGTGVMQRLNSLQNPFSFSGGGLVRSAPRFADGGMVSATTSDGATVNLHFPGGSFEMRADKGIVAGLTREARRAGMLSAGRDAGGARLMFSGSTILVISGPGVPTYSARGLTQTLDPIDASSVMARTVNGALIDLSPSQMRKYKSTISCTDHESPALDGIWPGVPLTVDCVPELGYLTAGGTPQRTVVSGSSRVSGAWTYYRPRLNMLVVKYSVSTDEWGAAVAWSLDLEEI